ncbi:MAG TPA: hypothetical protein VEY91_08025 [Candidatus Limnocylindria bacterium]|nr:hypothetical protein [Candidatus Limnocylindria bacterium]
MSSTLETRTSRTSTRSLLPIVALLAAWSAYFITYILAQRPPRLLTRTFDDACYYLKIAQNAANGLGLTFDGMAPTNGFQPLWLYLLVPIIRFVDGSPERIFKLSLVLQVLIMATAAVLLYTGLGKIFSGRVVLVSALFFVPAVFYPSVNGMESSILILCMVVLFLFGLHNRVFEQDRAVTALGFGLLLGLTHLARLDTLFLSIAIGVVCLWAALRDRARAATHLRRLLWIGFGCALVVMPYLIYNYRSFGAFVPISGILKSSFPHVVVSGTLLEKFGVRHLAYLALAALVLIGFLFRRRWGWMLPAHPYVAAALAATALAMLMHATQSTLFMKWAAFRWHFAWYGLVAAVALLAPLEALLASRTAALRKLATPLAILVLAAGTAEIYRKDSRDFGYDWHAAMFDAATWARNHTPKDAVLAMPDAGFVSFFSGRRVVNLDGLVNDLTYQEYLRQGRLGDYLDARGVQYLIVHDFGADLDLARYESAPIKLISYKYETWSEPVIVRQSDEVFRSPVYPYGRHRVMLAIWRRNADPPAARVTEPMPPAGSRPGT